MFVDSQVRRGIFPEMLADVIDTRVMIKQAMKRYKGESAVGTLYDSHFSRKLTPL